MGYPWPLSSSVHDRTCAATTTRFAYCDCAIGSGRARTLTQLVAIAAGERAEAARNKAIVDRAEDESEYATDPAVRAVLHTILTGEDPDQ